MDRHFDGPHRDPRHLRGEPQPAQGVRGRGDTFVGNQSNAANDFEAIQSAQVLARTYAELIQSENVADLVAEELPGDETAGELLERMSFSPISDTQLLVVAAEGDSPEEAADLANTYAETFAQYADDELSAETNGEVSVADRAQPRPRRPAGPTLYAAVMFVFALFLGAGLALLRDRWTRALGSEDDLARELNVPVLARVPSIARRRLSRSRERASWRPSASCGRTSPSSRPGAALSVVVGQCGRSRGQVHVLARARPRDGGAGTPKCSSSRAISAGPRWPCTSSPTRRSRASRTTSRSAGASRRSSTRPRSRTSTSCPRARCRRTPRRCSRPDALTPARRGLRVGGLRHRRQPAALGRRRRHDPRARRRHGHVRRQPPPAARAPR